MFGKFEVIFWLDWFFILVVVVVLGVFFLLVFGFFFLGQVGWDFFSVDQIVPSIIPYFPSVMMHLTYLRLTDKIVTICTGRCWNPMFLTIIHAQFGDRIGSLFLR